MSLTVQSTAFKPNEVIPARYSEDGENISPPISWSGAPAETKEFVLICDDPDAPRPQPWVHWLLYKIPASLSALPENVAKTPTPPQPAGSMQGKNSWGRFGYGGPAPPKGHGVHHYHFRLYALDVVMNVETGMEKNRLLPAIREHVMAEGELIGTYERK